MTRRLPRLPIAIAAALGLLVQLLLPPCDAFIGPGQASICHASALLDDSAPGKPPPVHHDIHCPLCQAGPAVFLAPDATPRLFVPIIHPRPPVAVAFRAAPEAPHHAYASRAPPIRIG